MVLPCLSAHNSVAKLTAPRKPLKVVMGIGRWTALLCSPILALFSRRLLQRHRQRLRRAKRWTGRSAELRYLHFSASPHAAGRPQAASYRGHVFIRKDLYSSPTD